MQQPKQASPSFDKAGKQQKLNAGKLKQVFRRALESENEDLAIRYRERLGCLYMQLGIVAGLMGEGGARQAGRQGDWVDGVREEQELEAEGSVQNIDIISSSEGEQRYPSKLSSKSSTFSSPTAASSSSSSTFQSPLSISTQHKLLESLSIFLTQTQQNLSLQLLQKQTQLQHEEQQAQILSLYEHRIAELQQVRTGKENDISTEHVGIAEGGMRVGAFRAFRDHCVEIENVQGMWQRIRVYRREIGELAGRDGQGEQLKDIGNEDDSGIGHRRTFRGKENILEIVLKPEHKTLVKTQPCSRINTFNDPFFRRILRKLKSQLSRQKSLQAEHKLLVSQLHTLNSEHKNLARQYISLQPHVRPL